MTKRADLQCDQQWRTSRRKKEEPWQKEAQHCNTCFFWLRQESFFPVSKAAWFTEVKYKSVGQCF